MRRATRARAEAREGAAIPRLASLTAVPFVNNQGIVYPHVAQDAEAHVFAVYDEFDFLQFIGFSKDLRNSLRTLLVRVPDQTMKFKHVDLPELDQERMLAIRKEWLAEVAPNVPPGLTAAGKETWAKPIECGSRRAAEQRWRALLDDVRLRGAREEFEYNEELIEQGIVDVAPSVLSDADRAAIEADFEAQSNRLKDVTIVVDNRPISFKISVTERFVSKTGAMLDVELVTAEEDSTHVVVVSDAELERFDATREEIAARAMAVILDEGLTRDTRSEQLTTGTFPTSYFAVASLEQWFGARAVQMLGGRHAVSDETPVAPMPHARHWNFKRVDTYGPGAETSAPALGADGL